MDQTRSTNNVRSETLNDAERDAVRALLNSRGERATLDLLGVSRPVLYRAMAGLAVRRGSIALIGQGLASLAADVEKEGAPNA